jgi:hypothetical protein
MDSRFITIVTIYYDCNDLLQFITIYYDLLRFITIYYDLLRFITIYYDLLRFITIVTIPSKGKARSTFTKLHLVSKDR